MYTLTTGNTFQLPVCHAVVACVHVRGVNHSITTLKQFQTKVIPTTHHTSSTHVKSLVIIFSIHYQRPLFFLLSSPSSSYLVISSTSTSTIGLASTCQQQSQAEHGTRARRCCPHCTALLREGGSQAMRGDVLGVVVSVCGGLERLGPLVGFNICCCHVCQKGSIEARHSRVVVYRSRCCTNN